MTKRFGVLGMFIVMACLFLVPLGSSQEDPGVGLQGDMPKEEDLLWAWGEVKAIDAAASCLNLTYMDYESDEEKELVLNIDQDTKFENVSGLSGIMVGDIASIDYAAKGGKNIAKNISIEKMEEAPEAPLLNVSVTDAQNISREEPAE